MVREKLKVLKAQKNWSNKRLAEEANLPEDTVAKILAGTTRNPNTDTLRRLATALGVTLDELTAETSAPPAPVLPEKLSAAVRSEPACGEIVRIYEQQLEKMEARYERRLAEAHAREAALARHSDIRFYVTLIVIAALLLLIIYLIIDALHGDWGFFQYSEALRGVLPSLSSVRDALAAITGGTAV